jgi:hypothetical protein
VNMGAGGNSKKKDGKRKGYQIIEMGRGKR